MKNAYMVLFLGAVITCLAGQDHLLATKPSSSIKAGEQKKAEKGLKDNKYFIYFINASITNTGTEEQKRMFRTAIQHDIVAQFYYLRFSFHESYGEIRTAQRLLIDLYRANLLDEIRRTRSFLNSIAPDVILSRDTSGRKYISLSYRLLAHSKTYMGMADNYKNTLYSLRLYKYVKAMKKLKEAKRYAVTATLQVHLPDRYLLQRRRQTFETISALIREHIPGERQGEVLDYHTDSYYRVTGEMSQQERVWEEEPLEEFEPYRQYLETTD